MKDPFKEYYEEAGRDSTPIEEEGDARIKKAISEDAVAIKDSINSFIKKLNALIAQVFDEEKDRGTRQDLIVTLVLGGLAFTVANVWYLVRDKFHSNMSAADYLKTFLGMHSAAMKDIEKKGGAGADEWNP